MGQKIWRYVLSQDEQKLWGREDMAGWCKALEGCVEDEAREQGSKKYVICDRSGAILAKNLVSRLPEPKGMAFGRDSTIY